MDPLLAVIPPKTDVVVSPPLSYTRSMKEDLLCTMPIRSLIIFFL